MKVTADKIDKHNVALTIEVPSSEVDKAFERAYQRLVNKVNIPGFRKGKAPRKILEAKIGKEAIADEAFELLAQPAYDQALVEQQLEPVNRPQVEVIQLVQGQPLIFKATVTVKPEVVLGQYKELTAAMSAAAISDDDILSEIDKLRERNAKMTVAPEAELQMNDFAVIDFAGTVDGQPFSGGDAKGYPLELGSGSFIPGFEEQLLGAKAGESRDVTVTFPEDYFVKELAAKEAVFSVQIQDVKRKELPAVDADFVKEVSEFETVEELKADLKNKLETAAIQENERKYKDAIVKQAINNAQFELPDIMIESRINQMLNDMAMNLESRGLKLEMYLKYMNMDMAGLRESYRNTAEEAVRADLVFAAIAKAEAMTVVDAEIEQEIQTMADNYKASVEDVREIIMEQERLETLCETILRKKAMQLVLDTAVQTAAE